MNSANIDGHITDLYDYALKQGFTEDVFLCHDNQDRYIETATDGYRAYPLFRHVFAGGYDEKTLSRMMSVDFKSRLGTTAGIASSSAYESVMLIEPPNAKKTGMLQYVRVADPGAYTMLLYHCTYRQEDFEKFALEKRKSWLDDKTWYIYIFATRHSLQGMGYGKKLMELMISYADRRGYRLCLETNATGNVAMYGHFGFDTVDTSEYKDVLDHYVMLYTGKAEDDPDNG